MPMHHISSWSFVDCGCAQSVIQFMSWNLHIVKFEQHQLQNIYVAYRFMILKSTKFSPSLNLWGVSVQSRFFKGVLHKHFIYLFLVHTKLRLLYKNSSPKCWLAIIMIIITHTCTHMHTHLGQRHIDYLL